MLGKGENTEEFRKYLGKTKKSERKARIHPRLIA